MYGPGKVGNPPCSPISRAHVARGESWGGSARCRRVLWVDLEQGPRRLTRTFRDMDADAAEWIDVWSELGDPPKISALRETIALLEPALVIIDSLSKFCRVEEDNGNGEWQAALAP